MPTTEQIAELLEQAESLGLFQKPSIPRTIHYIMRLSDNTDYEDAE